MLDKGQELNTMGCIHRSLHGFSFSGPMVHGTCIVFTRSHSLTYLYIRPPCLPCIVTISRLGTLFSVLSVSFISYIHVFDHSFTPHSLSLHTMQPHPLAKGFSEGEDGMTGTGLARMNEGQEDASTRTTLSKFLPTSRRLVGNKIRCTQVYKFAIK